MAPPGVLSPNSQEGHSSHVPKAKKLQVTTLWGDAITTPYLQVRFGGLMHTPRVPIYCWKPWPQKPSALLGLHSIVEKVVCLNKALWAQDKMSTDVFQTESILSPGFHNFRPKQIPVQEGEELCAQHWAGRRMGTSSRRPMPWERLPHWTCTKASSQQAPEVDDNSSRGPMEAPLKMVTSRQKNQWITSSSLTQNKIN